VRQQVRTGAARCATARSGLTQAGQRIEHCAFFLFNANRNKLSA
jgi:hypothetical protein